MSYTRPLCGAATKNGRTCRNVVNRHGSRCRLHRPIASSAKFFKACISTASAVVKVVGAGVATKEAIELYVFAEPYLKQLGALLAPEDFWVEFLRQDNQGMRRRLAQAQNQSQESIVSRYRSLPPPLKREVMEAYSIIQAKCQHIALQPNPSIERTSPGKPGAASHVKR